LETLLASNSEWARLQFSAFAVSNSDYLDGIVHEAEHNVQPLFGLAVMVIVGIGLAVIDNILASQPVLGADELPMWLVTPAFMTAYLLSGPLSKMWIRRSIKARVATALRAGIVE